MPKIHLATHGEHHQVLEQVQRIARMTLDPGFELIVAPSAADVIFAAWDSFGWVSSHNWRRTVILYPLGSPGEKRQALSLAKSCLWAALVPVDFNALKSLVDGAWEEVHSRRGLILRDTIFVKGEGQYWERTLPDWLSTAGYHHQSCAHPYAYLVLMSLEEASSGLGARMTVVAARGVVLYDDNPTDAAEALSLVKECRYLGYAPAPRTFEETIPLVEEFLGRLPEGK